MVFYMFLKRIKNDNVFPSKFSWKKLIKHKIQESELSMWHDRTSQPEFDRFKRVHSSFKVHYFWKLSKQKPNLLIACKSIMQMISCIVGDSANASICHKCNRVYVNIIDHCISECERVLFWDKIYQFNPEVYMYLRGLDKISLSSLILGEDVCDFNMLLLE